MSTASPSSVPVSVPFLLDRFRSGWGLRAPDEETALREAVAAAPEIALRVLRCAELLVDADERPSWARGVADGFRPLELLREGVSGLVLLDEILVERFLAEVPPEAFPTGRPAPADPAACEAVLRRLLSDRAAGGRGWSFVDPLSGRRHARPVTALARAIEACAARSDGRSTRALLIAALEDAEPRLRRAAVVGLGKFLGFAEVRTVLARLRRDGEESVRAALAGTLSPFAGRPEIRGLLLALAGDPAASVRRRAADALLAGGALRGSPDEQEAERMLLLACDPDAGLAERVRQALPQGWLEARCRDLLEETAAGCGVHASRLWVVARAPGVPHEERCRVLAERIDRLSRAGAEEELWPTVRAVGHLQAVPTPALGGALRRLLRRSEGLAPGLLRSLAMVLEKDAGGGLWDVLEECLEHVGLARGGIIEQRLLAAAAEAAMRDAGRRDAVRRRVEDRTSPAFRRLRWVEVMAAAGDREVLDRLARTEAVDAVRRRARALLEEAACASVRAEPSHGHGTQA